MWLVDTAPTFTVDVGSTTVGTVTVTLTRGDGTVIATGAATVDNTDGTYSYTLSKANNTRLDLIRLDWLVVSTTEVVTTFEETVGSLLFTLEQARNSPIVGQQTPLTDTVKYPDQLIDKWRSAITELFEHRLRRGVVERYCRLELSGPGGSMLDLSYGHARTAAGTSLDRPGRIWDISRVISATVGGVAQSVGDLQVVGYKLHHTTSSWTAGSTSDPVNIAVEYEYGANPVEAEIHQRGLDMFLANAAPSGFPSTATSISNDDGTFSITTFPAAVEDMFKTRKARAGFGFA